MTLNIKWIGSPNFGYGRGVHGQNKPEVLVWHITASGPSNPPLAGLDNWFQNTGAGSTQFGIQDDDCHQYVKIEDACWGQGYMTKPNLSNPFIANWWNLGINPNLRSIGIEVVAQPGPMKVRKGYHGVNEATWNTMKELGLHLTKTVPSINLTKSVFAVYHGMIDGINRARDTVNVYWPEDILADILKEQTPEPVPVPEPEPEEEDMAILIREKSSNFVFTLGGVFYSYLEDIKHATKAGTDPKIHVLDDGALGSYVRADRDWMNNL